MSDRLKQLEQVASEAGIFDFKVEVDADNLKATITDIEGDGDTLTLEAVGDGEEMIVTFYGETHRVEDGFDAALLVAEWATHQMNTTGE